MRKAALAGLCLQLETAWAFAGGVAQSCLGGPSCPILPLNVSDPFSQRGSWYTSQDLSASCIDMSSECSHLGQLLPVLPYQSGPGHIQTGHTPGSYWPGHCWAIGAEPPCLIVPANVCDTCGNQALGWPEVSKQQG